MSYKNFIILTILFAVAGQVLASRDNPETSKNNNGEMKQPEWFLKSDNSVLIPGIGRILVPPAFTVHTVGGVTGSSRSGTGTGTGTDTGTGTGSHIPGGDDTSVPNPGHEVPTLGTGNGGGVPTAARP